MRKGLVYLFVAVALLMSVSGCAGLEVALENRKGEVVTSTSDPLFLDVYDSKDIFIKYVNGSGHAPLDKVKKTIVESYKAKGHSIVKDYKKADLIIAVKVLNAKKVAQSAREVKGDDNKGLIGGTLAGAAAGSNDGLGGVFAGAIIGGVGGGLADLTVNSFVELGMITLVTDIQVAQRVDGEVNTKITSTMSQGGGTGKAQVEQTQEIKSNFRKYRMQAVTRATKANLEWEDVEDKLIKEISRISGQIV